jgi:hypothetical protein
MIEIESGIPIPATKRPGAGRRSTYPFAVLDVGQSFFVPNQPGKTNRQLIMAIGCAAQRITKKTGHRFTSRTLEGGIRVWRFE